MSNDEGPPKRSGKGATRLKALKKLANWDNIGECRCPPW